MSLIMLSLPLSAPVRAFKACVVYLFDPLAYYGDKGVQRLAEMPPGVSRLLSADMENVRLQAEIRRAQWQKAELESLRNENRRLSGALGLKAPAARSALWADVMERDPLHWYSNIMVNVGSRQGVALNAPVFAEREGEIIVIGRVTEVRNDTAIVLLVTDELSSIAVYLSSAGVDGLAQGQGGPRLRVNYLPAEVPLAKGDMVYTSQTSATFPGDVLVGRVTAVNPSDPFLTFQSVEVQPAVNATSLNNVMILRSEGPAGEPAAVPLQVANPIPPAPVKPKKRDVVKPVEVARSTTTPEGR